MDYLHRGICGRFWGMGDKSRGRENATGEPCGVSTSLYVFIPVAFHHKNKYPL